MLLVDVLDAQTLKSVGELARAQMQKKFIARAAVKKQGFQAAQSGGMISPVRSTKGKSNLRGLLRFGE